MIPPVIACLRGAQLGSALLATDDLDWSVAVRIGDFLGNANDSRSPGKEPIDSNGYMQCGKNAAAK